MSQEPTAKRIKLSLEPAIDNNVVDITNAGQEILKTDTSLPEKLMQSVDRIWFERGEWKDISEKSLMASIEKRKQQPELEKKQEIETENAPPSMTLPPGFDIAKLRESVINKLFHAKSEIDVALDVINILAAGNRGSSAAVKDLVLPAGSLTATYVTKPKPTTKSQLESVQLNLGLKRKKQKQASDFLKKSASALKKLVEKEQVFWDEALDLRRNNWQMQANGNAGASFFVQYGYTDVGSDFNEQSVGELKRASEDDETLDNLLQMSLPHSICRKVAVRISQSHMGKLSLGGQNELSEGMLGILEDQDAYVDQDGEGIDNQGKGVAEKVITTYADSLLSTSHSKIQNQLAEAHSIVFDAELFSDILAEAQALDSNVRFPDDEIVINIDGQIDLHVSKVSVGPSDQLNQQNQRTKLTSQQIVSRSIDLSFRLLLLQHQRFNLWKTKAKILSSNHRIHQLLSDTSVASSTASSAATPVNTAATNAPTPTNSGGGAGSTPAPTPTAATLGGVLSTVGTGGSVVTAGRARTRLASSARDLPKHIPILLPIMSLTRFWVQFDRIRHVTNKTIREYHSLPISVHYKFADSYQTETTSRPYDTYPGYGQAALCLGLSILRGPSLHFNLSQSGAISVCLPQITVVLQNVSEFEAFLSREIKVICLRTVCDVANDLVKSQQWWQVDQVDEAIHGSVWWHSGASNWRNINFFFFNSHLEFKLNATQDQKESIYILKLNQLTAPMHFKEKVHVIIKEIIKDGQKE
ncbi:subunit 17 of mediator complex-domain-containing protein [Parasitella parasitica]|nr:subunit 17 of mediator complex-domain-containing protein [Parasitella parasitica]